MFQHWPTRLRGSWRVPAAPATVYADTYGHKPKRLCV